MELGSYFKLWSLLWNFYFLFQMFQLQSSLEKKKKKKKEKKKKRKHKKHRHHNSSSGEDEEIKTKYVLYIYSFSLLGFDYCSLLQRKEWNSVPHKYMLLCKEAFDVLKVVHVVSG